MEVQMSDEQKYAHLVRHLELFRGLSLDDVAEIFHKGMILRFNRDETVFQKGTRGNLIYVIIEGQIGIYDGESHLASLDAGETFGEMGMVFSEPRCASAVALAPSMVFALSEDAFEKLLKKRVAVRLLLNIIRPLTRRLREANDRLANSEDPASQD